MKKAILGLGMILILLGVTAGIFGWTAITVKDNSIAEGEYGASEYEDTDTESEDMDAGRKASDNLSAEDEVSTEEQTFEEQKRLAYSQLDVEAQKTYDEILKACEDHVEEMKLTTLNKDIIENAYQAVICDHGGIFWVNGYTYTLRTLGEQVQEIDFRPSYTFSQEERETYQEYVDETVQDYLARLSPDVSDYEKVKYVYEMLIYNVKYNVKSEENQNILSVFLFGESVCSGFASAAQYLLSLLDVPCMIVYGTSEGEPHAWNLVYIENEPYFFDATWGSTLSETVGECSYAYLNLTSRDIETTHRIDMLLDVPECTSVTDNYYAKEGRFFTVFDEAVIGRILGQSYEAGEKTTALKFSSDEVYRQAYQAFITDTKVADYCSGLERIGYVENQELRVLTFQWR